MNRHKYGEYLDDEPIHTQDIYYQVSQYFDNPIMTKVRYPVESGKEVYMAQMKSYLGKEKRYIIVVVDSAYSILDRCYLSQLKWETLQTRLLEESYNIPLQTYNPKRDILNIPLTIQNRNEKRTIYTCKGYNNISVYLLHTKESVYEYPDKGYINNALETYKTILHISL